VFVGTVGIVGPQDKPEALMQDIKECYTDQERPVLSLLGSNVTNNTAEASGGESSQYRRTCLVVAALQRSPSESVTCSCITDAAAAASTCGMNAVTGVLASQMGRGLGQHAGLHWWRGADRKFGLTDANNSWSVISYISYFRPFPSGGFISHVRRCALCNWLLVNKPTAGVFAANKQSRLKGFAC
jgi:hypothetical protein